MPHAIILNCIDALQGPNTEGTGTLETLKGLMDTVESIEESLEGPNAQMPTPEQEAVLEQANIIASMCGEGFTCTSISEATEELETRIDRL